MFNTQSPRKTRLNRPGLWAVSCSLGLHAALLLWWGRARDDAPPVVRPTLTWLDVQTVPQAAQAPSPVPEESPRPAPPSTKQAAPSRTRAPNPAAVAPEETRSRSPFAAALRDDAPMRLPQPRAQSVLPSSGDAPGLPVAPPDAGVTVEQQVARWTRQAIGEHRAQSGLVHTYYATLGKALLKGWDAERPLKSTGMQALGEQFVQNTQVWNEIWQRHAQTFGQSGSPFRDAPPADRRVAIPNERSPIGTPDLVARRALAKEMREEFKATRRATVRVTQDNSGKLLKVELVEPSNDANVDREAVADIRAAAQQLPVPPPEISGANTPLVSLWQFELIISITPPIPTFSFEFDEALGFIDARLPLDRRIYKRVRLVSLE